MNILISIPTDFLEDIDDKRVRQQQLPSNEYIEGFILFRLLKKYLKILNTYRRHYERL